MIEPTQADKPTSCPVSSHSPYLSLLHPLRSHWSSRGLRGRICLVYSTMRSLHTSSILILLRCPYPAPAAGKSPCRVPRRQADRSGLLISSPTLAEHPITLRGIASCTCRIERPDRRRQPIPAGSNRTIRSVLQSFIHSSTSMSSIATQSLR